ncbi:alpha-galactosidase [Kocuria sp.]|uniref:alpha-galactosidase n=1 Tax=Kocuria sp. TaxID=1871328 RepID=UPI0026DF5D14|nr:alpha-galactosidase [Kocuria sp.]MDO5618922.1 alpha-galactosidase [Kocuria sp.]
MEPTPLNAVHPSTVPGSEQHIHLRSGGVSLLLSRPDGRIPTIAHWGADLGALTEEDVRQISNSLKAAQAINCPDAPMHVGLVPEARWGWAGRPGLVGHRDGQAWAPDFRVRSTRFLAAPGPETEADGGGANQAQEDLAAPYVERGAGQLLLTVDSPEDVELAITIHLSTEGVVRLRATVTNRDVKPYHLEELGLVLPVALSATELQDFAGHWGQERRAQHSPFTVGLHLREGRKGRTGADAAHLMIAGEAGFGYRTGQVWGVHTGFSGNHRTWAEREYSGQKVLGGSELLLPAEMVLTQDHSYTTPWIYGVWGEGLDDQAHRLHGWIRSRPQHPNTTRPATLNVWEAVYFDHDLEKLTQLAERAARIGIERFVLDDGWFGSRRDDTSGLGDWVVSPDAWPNGLTPLIERVNELGMEFGLWFEPEMINVDSELAKHHPEWILGPSQRLAISSRSQQVLDIGNPEAYAHVRDQMMAVLANNNISYIKWDHNRDLVEAGSSVDGKTSVHRQTLAAYRLMAELKSHFPGLEIEACASGGGRVDLGIIEHTDRFWTSDCIDPAERQEMHRWTQQLVPPELMGSHVAAGRSHETGRLHDLNFRAGTALWGHFGVEWDLTQATSQEMRELAEWIAVYKRYRNLLHTGKVIRLDQVDPEWDIHGVVTSDGTEALFAVVCTGVSITDPVGRLTLAGLVPDLRYRLEDITPDGAESDFMAPGWWPDGGVVKGSVLLNSGIHTPRLWPDRMRLLHLTATT